MDLSKSIPKFLEGTNESKPAVAPLPTVAVTDPFAQSVQIALDIANEGFAPVPRTDARPPPVPVVADDHQLDDGGPKQDLTFSQITEAIELIGEVAESRGPFASETSLGGQSEAIVRALCIVATYLVEQRQPRAETIPIPIVSSARGTLTLQDYLDSLERSEIVLAIEHAKHNKTLAAKILGITFRSLRYRLDRLEIK